MMWLRLAGVVALLAWPAFADQTLPSFHVAATQTSVSGLSSGAFMAVQFHTAYSARVMGVGVVAGGPYDCVFAHYPGLVDPVTNPFVVTAGIDICMNANPAPPDGAESWRKAQHFADIEDIDTTGHLAQSRVYVFSGSKDKTVVPSVAAAAYAYYRAAGVPPANIQYVHDIPAGHAFISPAAQQDCDKTGSPYINRWVVDGRPYDQAGAILTQIYGPLNAPSLELGGRKITFDQARYGDAMGPTGFLYVPRSCNEGATCVFRSKSARHSDIMSAGDSDLMSAVPI
jgi:hypothetical protein